MEKSELKTPAKKFFSGILIIMLIFSIVSCSKKVLFLNSSVVPAATGSVKVKLDKNKNYVIQIQITNLAGVERLQPARKTYIVWMLTDGQLTKNIGRVSSSSKLKVSFSTVSSFKPIQIFITSEDDENAQSPDEKIVLSTEKFWI
jgi:hypothetical protein